MAKDFKAGQIKTSKIITKDGEKLFVYSGDLSGVADEGVNTISDSDIGDDVSVYFHGVPDKKGVDVSSTGDGVTLFNGDIVVSGTLYAEKQVIDVHTGAGGLTIDGATPITTDSGNVYNCAIHISGVDAGAIIWDAGDAAIYENFGALVLSSSNGMALTPGSGEVVINPGQNDVNFRIEGDNTDYLFFTDAGNDIVSIQGAIGDNSNLFQILGNDDAGTGNGAGLLIVSPAETVVNPSGGDVDFRVESNTLQGAILVDSADDQVLLASNNTTAAGASLGTDVNVFVDGIAGSKDSVNKGTTVFVGDVVISGSLHGGSPLKIGTDTRLDAVAGSTQYFNFGATDGSAGYGLRSNAGAIEFKNNAGAWAGIGSGGGGFDVEADIGPTHTIASGDSLNIVGNSGIATRTYTSSPGEVWLSLQYGGTDNFIKIAPNDVPVDSDWILFWDASSASFDVKRSLISDLPFADGEMTSFDLEDDIGNNTTITDGETLEVRGGPGLKTAVNPNRLDIEHDIDALTDIVTPDVNDYLIIADSTSTPSVTKRVKIGALPSGGGGGSPGGSAGDVQINDGSSGFDGAAHLKYDTTDNRVWLGSGTVPGTYNAKLHISSELIVPALPALPIDDAPTLRIDTKSGSPANDNESLLIDHAGTSSGTKIVKIDAKAAELFIIDNDGLIELTAANPKLVINSTGTDPNDEAFIKLTDSSTVVDGSLILSKQGDLLIANTEDSKIAQIVGKYGGASAQYYNIIRGEVGGVNKPTVMIQTDPFSLSGGATSAIGSNDINFYVEGTPASLGSTSVKGASKFAGDLKVVGCVSRGGILHLSNGPSGPQVYWIGGSGGHPHPDGVSTGTGPYSTAMEPTWVDSVIWNTTLVTDPLFYDLSPSKTDIKIKKAGTYKISYSVNLSQLLPATNRINMRTFLHQTTAPSTVTAIDCSEAWSYGRGVGSADTVSKMSNVCTTTKIFAENEEFNLNMVFLHGVRDTEVKVNVRSNQSWILIERIA